MAAPTGNIRVLELYSGIGGMHCALAGSGIPYEVVMAADVNTCANFVYSHNFPKTLVNSSAIESLTVTDFEDLKVDMILMSPPCQPFTRVGKQKDTSDIRTKSFLHVLNVLKKMENRPDYILVENVKGFESSESRQRLVDTLQACQYIYQEFLLTPLQFGIPNSRLRYFLIAKKKPKSFIFESTEQIMSSVPECASNWLSWKQIVGKKGSANADLDCACYGQCDVTRVTSDVKLQSNGGVKRTSDCDQQETADSGTVCKRQKVDSADETKDESGVNASAESNVNNECKEAKATLDLQVADSDGKVESDEGKTHKDKDVQNSVRKSSDCLQNYGGNLRLPLTDEQKDFGVCVKLHNFLEDQFNCEALFKDYLIPEKEFKRLMVMDVVNGCSQKTCCFTKRYGHYINGAGSLVVMTRDTQAIQKASELKRSASELKNRDKWADEEFSIISDLKLRYFTPREIANILCFPATYSFPEGFSHRQLYMLLGNSLNVHIVTGLIRIMTAGDLNIGK